jgi:hypothetical protein
MGYDPRSEAFHRLDGEYEVRVLEPSPPAVDAAPWFADDPAARGDVPDGRRLVSPVSSGDVTWDELARADEDLAGWCADRWLGAWRRLESLPDGFVACRDALHALAEGTFKPAREAANGKIGLRYTRGGFGTPFFGNNEQLRVEGPQLVRERAGEEVARDPIDGADAACVAALADWYGFGASVLEEVRVQEGGDDARVQIWPEHFDIAATIGGFTLGGSPGDEQHDEPYLYVLPPEGTAPGDRWNAELRYAELLASPDQRADALDFFRARMR